MTPEEYEQWSDIILRATRFALRDFPDLTRDDKEDVTQDVWEFTLKLLVRGKIDLDTPSLSRRMVNKTKELAWKIRKEHLGQSAQYLYQNSSVRKILETVFDRGLWESAFVPDDARSADSLTHADALDLRADVSQVIDGLPSSYKTAIISRYQLGIEPEAGTSQRKQLNRAIQRLTDRLNMYYRGATGRRAITNATSRAIIADQETS